MEEKLIFLVYLFAVLNTCVFNFSFLSSESQSCWKIPVNGQKKGQKQKKKKEM